MLALLLGVLLAVAVYFVCVALGAPFVLAIILAVLVGLVVAFGGYGLGRGRW